MDRREFFQKSLIATVASRVLSDITLAQAVPPAAGQGVGATQGRHLVLDAYARHLQWIRNTDELAEAAVDLTCGGVCPLIQSYPGHVNPANIKTDLPAFVSTMKKHGLRVKQVRGGTETQVDAGVDTLLGTMQQAGVTHYSLGTDTYDLTKPIMPQLDAIKMRVDQFVRLNQKYGTTLTYYTAAGGNAVGAVVWDLLYVLKDFDPRHVGFHWDTGSMARHGNDTWELLMRTAGPYVAAMSWQDRSWVQELPLKGEGGPYPGPGGTAAAAGGRGRGGAPPAGGRGGPVAPAGAGAGAPPAGAAGAAAGPGGREAGAPPAGAGGRGAAVAADPAAGGEDVPAAGGRGGRGGRGGGGAAGAAGMPRPLATEIFARGGGWTAPYVPMGTGTVDLFGYAKVLRDIGFDGPSELVAAYPNGGAEAGADKITLPREMVLGSMKRDILTLRAAVAQSGSGLII
jgi:hypothetical protein